MTTTIDNFPSTCGKERTCRTFPSRTSTEQYPGRRRRQKPARRRPRRRRPRSPPEGRQEDAGQEAHKKAEKKTPAKKPTKTDKTKCTHRFVVCTTARTRDHPVDTERGRQEGVPDKPKGGTHYVVLREIGRGTTKVSKSKVKFRVFAYRVTCKKIAVQPGPNNMYKYMVDGAEKLIPAFKVTTKGKASFFIQRSVKAEKGSKKKFKTVAKSKSKK